MADSSEEVTNTDTINQGEDTGESQGETDQSAEQQADQTAGEASTEQGEQDTDAGAAGFQFGDDWRNQIAGDDKSKLAQLERYSTPEAWLDSTWEAKQKARQNTSGQPPKEDAPEEEWAQWREDHSIPKTADEYDYGLDEVSAMDQPYFDDLRGVLHKHNLPNDVAADIANTLAATRADIHQSRQDQDLIAAQNLSNTLEEFYGPDMKANKAIYEHVLNSMEDEVKEVVVNARSQDGSPLIYNPGFLDAMVNIGRKAFPSVSVVPGSDNPDAAVETEVDSLKKIRSENIDEWHSSKFDKERNRLRDLYEYQERKGG